MNRENVVSLEIAKILKDLGFKDSCKYAYDDPNTTELHNSEDLTGRSYFTQEDIDNALENGFITFLAPFKQQTCM